MRLFLDTNVFIYSFDQSHPDKRLRASGLISDALSTECGVCSSQVVQEFTNVALRRFATPMTAAQCRSYLDTVLLPLCRHYPSPETYHDALALHERYSLSWYDSLIVAAAMALECDKLCSEDLQDGLEIGKLTISNPFL